MLNRCEFIGNLGQDPEVKSMNNGNQVCNLSIGVTEKWKDRQTGERKEKTEWVRATVFNEGLVKVCQNYLSKGSKIYLCGKMQTRKWQDQSGNDKYSTEIILSGFGDQIIMLDSRGDNSQSNNQQSQQSGGGDDGSSMGDLDDIVPFATRFMDK